MKYRRLALAEFNKVCDKPIVCFGVSKHIESFCRKIGDDSWKNHIVAFVDNNINLHGKSVDELGQKVPVYGANYLEHVENVNLLITVAFGDRVAEIVKQLQTMKISDTVECYCMIRMEREEYYDDSAIGELKADGTPRIEKIIHSFWFSKDTKPKAYQECIDSWKRYCPDYKIIEWNTDNYDVTKNRYMKQAFDKKSWAAASDYGRLDVVHEYGGIYLDMDVELLKSPTELLQHDAFFSIDPEGYVDLGSGFGAKKGLPIVKRMLDVYEDIDFLEYEDWGYCDGQIAQPMRLLKPFEAEGYKRMTNSQKIDDVLFLSPNYIRVIDDPTHKWRDFTGTEYAIHWHNAGWKEKEWVEERARKEEEKRSLFGFYDELCEEVLR